MDDSPPVDTDALLAAAADFASYPGAQTDSTAQEFIGRFPLQVVFSSLVNGPDIPGFEATLVSCLERIFTTKYGSSLIPHYMPFVRAGLLAESEQIRCLACNTVSLLLTNSGIDTGVASQFILEYDIYPLLVNCLTDGNELLATAAMDATVDLAGIPEGTAIVFPHDVDESLHMKNVAARCSSTARIRVLALIAKLFSASSLLASAINRSDLLPLFEEEVNNADDILMALSALELLYELADSKNATQFLLTTRLLQLLASMIRNSFADSSLRIRAIMISGRLLSKEEAFCLLPKSNISLVISAIDERLKLLKNEDTDESENALEALGQIGSSYFGASLLLLGQNPAASHVVMAGFEQVGRGRQLAALHALANIAGEKRPEEKKILVTESEKCLRNLIYAAATASFKLTPSVMILSVLRQESEIRMAAYRSISGLVKRSWFLVQLCSKQEIIDILSDPAIEATKNAMEARYNCCSAVYAALIAANDSGNSLTAVTQKLQEAVGRGPYHVKERMESQPVVVPAERF